MRAMKIHKGKPLGFGMALFYSVVMWGGVSVLTIFFALLDIFIVWPLCLLMGDKTRSMIHAVSRIWASGIINWNPLWRLAVSGQANIQKGKNYIIVANHQSLLDILAVAASLPLHFKFLAKRELFYIPFMGWAMGLAGYIPVDRSSHDSGKKAVFRISDLLKRGLSVLLFPEGTRSPDGKIHAFKMGAFKLARENNVEILPIVIEGTGPALPKKSMLLRKRSIFVVSIGKPVSMTESGDSSLDEKKEKVRHEMIARLEKIRHQKQG